MTEQEVFTLLTEIPAICCGEGQFIDSVDCESAINCLLSPNLEYEFVNDFIHNRFDFADMSGKRIIGYSRDIRVDEKGIYSYDYVYRHKNYLSDYNKTWKVYVPTEEERMQWEINLRELKRKIYEGEIQ